MVRIRASRVVLSGVTWATIASCGGGDKPAGPRESPPPAELEVVAGNYQTAPVATQLADPLVVRVLDGAGAPVRGQLINFRVIKGGGTVFAGSALSGDDGIARERWTLGTVARDTQQVEARAVDSGTGTAVVFAVFKAVGQPGPAVELRKVGGENQAAMVAQALPESLVVRLVDAYANGIGGGTVAWSTGSGTLSAATTTTDTAGRTAARWTLGTVAGPQHAVAASAGLPAATFTVAAHGAAPAAMQKMTIDGGEYPVGSAAGDSVGVRVVDAYGNPSASATVTFSVVSGGGNLSPASAATNSDGIARTRWVLGTIAGTNTLRVAASPGVETEFTATGRAAAPVSVAKVSPDPASAIVGSSVSPAPTVEARDAYGNPVSGVIVNFVVTAGGGTVTGSPATTGSDGRASVGSWTVGTTAVPNALSANAAGLPPATFSVTPSPGAVARVSIDAHPETLYVAQSIQLHATSSDAYGNPRADAVAWSLTQFSQSAVTITPDGLVTAIAKGSPGIVAQVGGIADTTALVAINRVSRVELTLGRSRIHAGDTTRATVRVFAKTDEVVRPYSLQSADNAVATVDASGLVTARANGTVGIVAESEGKTGIGYLDVVPYGARAVTIDPRSVTLIGGQSLQLTATAVDSLGQTLSNPGVFWASSNLAVAEISPAGIVYSKALGHATIRAFLDGGVDSIPMDVVSGMISRVDVVTNSTLYAGDSTRVEAQPRDPGGNLVPGKTFTWSASDTTRVRVRPSSSSSTYVIGLRGGSSTISATVEGVTGSATWTISPFITWQQMPSPTTQAITAVWGRHGADVYAATAGGVLHFDGRTWTNMGSGQAYERFWSPRPDLQLFARIGGSLFQYNGAQWSEVALTPPAAPFKKIWASSVDDVWAIFYDTSLGRDRLAHLNGGAWTISDLMNVMSDIWGIGYSDVWVTGENGQTFRFNGVTWLPITTLGPGNTGQWIGTDQPQNEWVYFQGPSGGHLSQFSPTGVGTKQESLIYSSGGSSGNTFTAPQALWSSAMTDVYTIQDGALYRFPGPSSPRLTLLELSGPAYRGVWGENRIIFVVGDGGVIMRGDLAYLR